eukprot:Skav209366  [mRNA]  locus=scaffold1388:131541:131816:- [translate_table: standard]
MNRATNQKLRDETNQLMRDGTVIFKHLRPRQAVIDLDDMPKECNERFAPSAYGVWVSEVMLQQTQVEVRPVKIHGGKLTALGFAVCLRTTC